jgi:FkbH-like protein
MSDGGGSVPIERTKPRHVAAKARWREHLAQPDGGDADLKIGIAASFTANNLAPFVGAGLLAAGMTPEFSIGQYNQLLQACLNPNGHFGGKCDAIVLLWRFEELVAEEMAAYLGGDGGALARAGDKLATLGDGIARLRADFGGLVIVGVPPYPTALPAGLSTLDNAVALGAFHRLMTQKFVDQVSAIEAVRLVDLDAAQRLVGAAASFDSRQWYLYRQPFSDAFLLTLGDSLVRIILASRRASKKCVVVDCDNTLWGGIIGEDGLDGIEIGDDFPGSAFRDFQKLLLHWRQQGVLIAIASKNNEADVWEVFDKHDGMVLRREHLSAAQVHWQPKAESLPRIARALNIGIDSLVFIDDNPMEIGHMRAAFPEVESILLPEDPADILNALRDLDAFDRLEVTAEDRQRADMMRAEQDREALASRLTQGDFLRELDLRFDLFQAEPQDLGRITQLINKTNQFNLTTKRRTLDEVRALAASPDHRIYGLRVADKFGEYGLTGVVITETGADRRSWVIDTLLLSCRVLGRGVEASLLAALADDARAAGVGELVASFIPTKKNALCATFLPDYGFVEEPGGLWRLANDAAPTVPDYVVRAEAAAA